MPDYNEYKVGMYLQSYKYLKRSLVKKYYIKLCQYMLDLTEMFEIDNFNHLIRRTKTHKTLTKVLQSVLVLG